MITLISFNTILKNIGLDTCEKTETTGKVSLKIKNVGGADKVFSGTTESEAIHKAVQFFENNYSTSWGNAVNATKGQAQDFATKGMGYAFVSAILNAMGGMLGSAPGRVKGEWEMTVRFRGENTPFFGSEIDAAKQAYDYVSDNYPTELEIAEKQLKGNAVLA